MAKNIPFLRPPEEPSLELHERAMDNLAFIRQTMERAGSFTAVSGWGQVVIGITGVLAAWLASRQASADNWLATWAVAAIVAMGIGVVTTGMKARAIGEPIRSGPGRKFVLSLAPPLVAGAVLTVVLFRAGLRSITGLDPGGFAEEVGRRRRQVAHGAHRLFAFGRRDALVGRGRGDGLAGRRRPRALALVFLDRGHGARAERGVDEVIVLAVAERDEHRLVLIFHQLPDGLGHVFGADELGVAPLHGLEDASSVHEEVRDDVRVFDARVLGLNMKHPVLVPDVVVVAEERRGGFRHAAEGWKKELKK
jgi:hypothetical protein